VLEFGANTGVNLKAIYSLIPDVKLDAVEINSCAAEALVSWGGCRHVYNDSLFAFKTNESYDLAFTSAVLIHINPDRLGECYRQLYSYTRRFILINEYYNPVPVEVPYRGHQGKLFKRDFAGEIMELFPQLQLRAYGFSYAKDPVFPGDDNTWFLLEKTN
jgi:spore coat polysaccharide biosynthesis protein SpsF